MRVLVASNLDSSRPFGQFTRPFHLAAGLAARGLEVGVVGVDCRKVDYGPSWSTGQQSARALAGALRTARRRFAPDVVYAHQNMPAFVAVATTRGVPVVADMHAVPSAEWQVFAGLSSGRQALRCRLRRAQAELAERTILRRADLVIAAGAEVAENLARRGRPRRPPRVVLNGVEADLLRAPAPPRPAAMPEGVPHAVATLPVSAWPANEQALAFLLDAAEVLHQRAPDARIHVLGTADGPAGPGLTYEGLVPELLPWLHHADACLLPYPPTAGACGGARNKLLEYLARGRAVVTTREGLRGLEEAGGWPGVVVAPDDAPGYATALAAALGNGHADAAAAREDLGRRLRWDVLAGEVETLLRSVA